MNILKVLFSGHQTSDVQKLYSTQGLTKDELAEFKAKLASMGSMDASRIDSIISNYEEVDTNNDGKVTMSEMQMYLKSKGLMNGFAFSNMSSSIGNYGVLNANRAQDNLSKTIEELQASRHNNFSIYQGSDGTLLDDVAEDSTDTDDSYSYMDI